jgi:hypothetical protein
MIAAGTRSDVSRNVATLGGTVATILAIFASEITPGPLGIADTKPIADAPHDIASAASLRDLIQQILILSCNAGVREKSPWH